MRYGMLMNETWNKGISNTRYGMENKASRNSITKWAKFNQKVTKDFSQRMEEWTWRITITSRQI